MDAVQKPSVKVQVADDGLSAVLRIVDVSGSHATFQVGAAQLEDLALALVRASNVVNAKFRELHRPKPTRQ